MAPTPHRQFWSSSQLYDVTAKILPPSGARALAARRLLAWGLELGLLLGSAMVPWYLGDVVRQRSLASDVPLSPVTVQVQSTMARTIGRSRQSLVTVAPPLTNLLWLGAIGLPLVVATGQLYWMQRSGRTLPKYWLGLRVTRLDGTAPGIAAVLIREVIGRWGLPLGIAYGIWLGIGAFPSLTALGGLALGLMLAQGLTSQGNAAHRAIYDYLAGTRVIYSGDSQIPIRFRASDTGAIQAIDPFESYRSTTWEPVTTTEESGGLTALVLSPMEPATEPSGVFAWRRYRQLVQPWSGWLLTATTLVGSVVLGNWLYDQRQANRQPSDQLFLALVDNLSLQAQTPSAKQAATLALASTQDPRAVRLFVDLLAQTGDPALMDTLQQALVTLGPQTIPYLRQLNQTLANDLVALSPERRGVYQIRQQTVKRTIAKILILNNGQLNGVSLSETDLGEVIESPDAFTLMLEQQNLAGMDWQNALLLGARFRKARFFDPGPDGRADTYDDWVTNFSGSDLTAASLVNAWLRHSNLKNASLLRANLSNVRAEYADFTGANASSAHFIEADLQHALLDQTSLTGADLTSANLTQASLKAARLKQVSGVGAILAQANLSEADATDADFSEANFTEATLEGSSFRGSRLKDADLTGANLQQANLQDADLRGVNFNGAVLVGTNFQGAQFFTAETADLTGFIASLPNLDNDHHLAGVDFSRAVNLDREQLQYICSQGGIHPACTVDP